VLSKVSLSFTLNTFYVFFYDGTHKQLSCGYIQQILAPESQKYFTKN